MSDVDGGAVDDDDDDNAFLGAADRADDGEDGDDHREQYDIDHENEDDADDDDDDDATFDLDEAHSSKAVREFIALLENAYEPLDDCSLLAHITKLVTNTPSMRLCVCARVRVIRVACACRCVSTWISHRRRWRSATIG